MYKAIVNLTAPCAENAYASFGHDAISKAAKKMALDVLSKERPDVKVSFMCFANRAIGFLLEKDLRFAIGRVYQKATYRS